MNETMEFGAPVIFRIHGRGVDGAYGEPLIDALRRHGHEVPSLCYHEAVGAHGGCRLCLVEVVDARGRRRITTSCNYPVQPGIDVRVETPEVLRHRRVVMELILAMAPQNEPLRRFARKFGLTPGLSRLDPAEHDDCILCGLCVRACAAMGVDAILTAGRGGVGKISLPFGDDADACIGCGACALTCPTGAIPLVDRALERRIWGRTFERIACTACGRPTLTREHAAHLARRTGLPDETFTGCDACRREQAARTFTDPLAG